MDHVRSVRHVALPRHPIDRWQGDKPQALCQCSGTVPLVMGFPASNFGQQVPSNAKKIAETCFSFYGVRFPMFNKISVVGKDMHPLCASLAQAAGQAPRCNFHKHLIDRRGRVVASFASDVVPRDN